MAVTTDLEDLGLGEALTEKTVQPHHRETSSSIPYLSLAICQMEIMISTISHDGHVSYLQGGFEVILMAVEKVLLTVQDTHGTQPKACEGSTQTWVQRPLVLLNSHVTLGRWPSGSGLQSSPFVRWG